MINNNQQVNPRYRAIVSRGANKRENEFCHTIESCGSSGVISTEIETLNLIYT